MAGECGRGQFKLVEQFAVTDDQIVPAIERMHRIRIALAGAGEFRRQNRVAVGEARDERTIGRETPRAVQIDERRPGARNLDFGVDLILPELDPAHLRGCHAGLPP